MVSAWLDRVKKLLSQKHRPLSEVPEDGTQVQTETPGVYAYRSAPERMRHARVKIPSISPQAFTPDEPRVRLRDTRLVWDYVERHGEKYVGRIVLKDGDKILLGLEYQSYVQPSDSGEFILAYHADRPGPASLTLNLLKTEDLEPLPLDQVAHTSEKVFFRNAKAVVQQVDLPPGVLKFDFAFAPELAAWGEIIAVLDVPWVKDLDPKNLSSTAIVCFRTDKGEVEILPQDWFNQSTEIDFGYQWITAAGRNSETGLLLGYGIRIANFELDQTGRQLVKGGSSASF